MPACVCSWRELPPDHPGPPGVTQQNSGAGENRSFRSHRLWLVQGRKGREGTGKPVVWPRAPDPRGRGGEPGEPRAGRPPAHSCTHAFQTLIHSFIQNVGSFIHSLVPNVDGLLHVFIPNEQGSPTPGPAPHTPLVRLSVDSLVCSLCHLLCLGRSPCHLCPPHTLWPWALRRAARVREVSSRP